MDPLATENARDEINRHLQELHHLVAVAALNYQLWWVYKNKDTRGEYVDTMNEYGLFFQVAANAHFLGIIIPLYCLYEGQGNTVNFPHTLRQIRAEGRLHESIIRKFEKEVESVKEISKKINVLRSRAFGHRSKNYTIDELFKIASITPNQIKDIIESSKVLLNNVAFAWGNTIYTFNLDATEDAVRLLHDLKSYNANLR
jgi:hypothetical protein